MRTVTDTELPFSTSGGRSRITPPLCGSTPPVKSRIAAARLSGVPKAGRTVRSAAALASAARRVIRSLLLVCTVSSSQRHQIGDHILDLVGAQHRPALEGAGDAGEAVGLIVSRHDAGGIEAFRIHQPQAQLSFAPARPRAVQRRREIALEALLRDRAGMAEQAEALLPARHDGPAARRVARPAGQRLR